MDIAKSLGKGVKQDAIVIDQILQCLHEYLEKTPECKTKYRVQKTNANTSRRKAALQEFPGIDFGTQHYLDEVDRTSKWEEDPKKFWYEPGTDSNDLDPYAYCIRWYWRTKGDDVWSRIAQRLVCIALVEFRDGLASGKPSYTSVGMALSGAAMAGQDPNSLASILKVMEKAGRAYKRLELHIGRGVCFVLGTHLKRSHFEKLLPAKDDDPVFEKFCTSALSNEYVVHSAAQYGPLRGLIAGCMVSRLQEKQSNVEFWQAVPLPEGGLLVPDAMMV